MSCKPRVDDGPAVGRRAVRSLVRARRRASDARGADRLRQGTRDAGARARTLVEQQQWIGADEWSANHNFMAKGVAYHAGRVWDEMTGSSTRSPAATCAACWRQSPTR